MINSTYLIALHGDFADGSILERDMTHLSAFVDEFPNWQDEGHDKWISKYKAYNICLLGYSRGGSEIVSLANELTNIKGAIVYEGPNFTSTYPRGRFPIRLGWNKLSRPLRNPLRKWTTESWLRYHTVIPFEGRGLHIRRVPGGDPPIGHNWDMITNPEHYTWMQANLP